MSAFRHPGGDRIGCPVTALLPVAWRHREGGRSRATFLVKEGRLFERAVDDRGWVELQPFVEDRRVDAAEIHVRVEVALNQIRWLHGRHLAVMAAFDLLAEHEGDAAGAVIGAGTIVAD